MSIWEYGDHLTDATAVREAVGLTQCAFCNTDLETLRGREDVRPARGVDLALKRTVLVCPICGWWTSSRVEFTTLPHDLGPRRRRSVLNEVPPLRRLLSASAPAPHERRVFGATACLRRLSLDDVTLPIEDVRAYLAAKYDARFQVHPRKLEEVVGSVFADHGYRARVTSYSGDDGLDVILDGPKDAVVGVQVKRYKDRIAVEQIRSLAGALVLRGITRGIFVTTSSFQSGAYRTAARYAERGIPIELVDAPRFLDALRVAQRTRYATRDDADAPFRGHENVLLSSESHPIFDAIFQQRMREPNEDL